MKKKKWNRVLAVLLAMVTAVTLLSGCGWKSAEKEDAETITVYLWTTNLYEKYAPYIQEQLPDINVEFVVGNNDLDFYIPISMLFLTRSRLLSASSRAAL